MNKKCKGNWNPDKIPQVRCSMYLSSVTNDEVEKIVMSLITKYTSDCFEISVFVIQSLIFGILDTLTFLINKALKAQTFPECLKRAVVVPIFKSGNDSEANNYRPISLWPTISKVFEKIVYMIRMTSFLKQTNQLHNNQFGFRSKLDTIDAWISVVDSIRYNLNKPALSTHAIFLDLKKAYEKVDHSILVEKLWRMGFRGPINTLLKSYLTNRKQKLRCGDTECSFLPLRRGVRCTSRLNFGTNTVYLVCKRSSGGYSEPNNGPLRRWHSFDTTHSIRSQSACLRHETNNWLVEQK